MDKEQMGTVPDPHQRLGPGVEGRGDEQVADLLPGPGGHRREISTLLDTVLWEDVGVEVGQCRGDVGTGLGAHRFHHPRGCATRLSAIPAARHTRYGRTAYN